MKGRRDSYLTTYAEGRHFNKGLLAAVFGRVDSFESSGTGRGLPEKSLEKKIDQLVES